MFGQAKLYFDPLQRWLVCGLWSIGNFFHHYVLHLRRFTTDLIAPNSVLAQKFILALWWVALVALLVFFVRLGARSTGASTDALLHKNTEDLQVEIDEGGKAHDGQYGGVNVPQPVPAAG